MKKHFSKLVFVTVVILLLIMAGTASAEEPYPLVEEFDTSEGFTSTSPGVYIADGQVHWNVSRSPAGYKQYIYRSIPAFTGDVRLTVRGQVKSYNNNCQIRAGIGDDPHGISINFGFYGGGCRTHGPVVMANGVSLDYHESYCNFTGNWLWINSEPVSSA